MASSNPYDIFASPSTANILPDIYYNLTLIVQFITFYLIFIICKRTGFDFSFVCLQVFNSHKVKNDVEKNKTSLPLRWKPSLVTTFVEAIHYEVVIKGTATENGMKKDTWNH